ncbi:chaoptin, partial [Eurytemora carolleeae]|uniref:chaoptin n=1 Tax=Eurytemora carolleeae TaxID=1294199 RepID=UPI000C76F1EB
MYILLYQLSLLVSLSSQISILDRKKLSSCKFNPLCLCSSNGDDLGAVECNGIELADVPQDLIESRVFALTLSSNSLRVIQEDRLRNMGCWSVEISRNLLTRLPPATFSGLERSVWRLILAGNRFQEIPYTSIQRLNKLNHLDLADNEICELDVTQLKTLPPSIKYISLAGNSIASVPEGVFWNLGELTELDLSRNMIINIHSMALNTGLPVLATLNLADNLLSKIPFMAIENLNALKML